MKDTEKMDWRVRSMGRERVKQVLLENRKCQEGLDLGNDKIRPFFLPPFMCVQGTCSSQFPLRATEGPLSLPKLSSLWEYEDGSRGMLSMLSRSKSKSSVSGTLFSSLQKKETSWKDGWRSSRSISMISWNIGRILGLYCQHICIRLCLEKDTKL